MKRDWSDYTMMPITFQRRKLLKVIFIMKVTAKSKVFEHQQILVRSPLWRKKKVNTLTWPCIWLPIRYRVLFFFLFLFFFFISRELLKRFNYQNNLVGVWLDHGPLLWGTVRGKAFLTSGEENILVASPVWRRRGCLSSHFYRKSWISSPFRMLRELRFAFKTGNTKKVMFSS